ncbi:MAG: Uma2 family endonuclease [Pyrinomonadaceae bacterium]
MSTETVDYLDAIAHLPAGATLRLPYVSWDEYEALLSELTDRPGLRVSYDAGRVEIIGPLPEHEEYKETILRLVQVMSEEAGVLLESRGSATYKQKRLAKGAEPDTSFYVQNAARIIGQRTIELGVDPPPDVVVEIDTTNESLGKFPIYAALGVPEIWRYDGAEATFFALVGTSYQAIANSRAFPALPASVLTEFIEQSKTQGQTATLTAFRQWWRAHAPSAD